MCRDDEELAWCAGFLDGDGSFSISMNGGTYGKCVGW